mgnify:CR=1 FL=1
MKVLCERVWGQPRLKLPKECCKANRIGTINWGERTRACPVWKAGNRVFVHHRDWNSRFVPCSSLNGAIRDKKKFVYADTYSGIVYAGHALIEYGPEDFAPATRRPGMTRVPITLRLGCLFGDPYDYCYDVTNYNEQLLSLLGLDIFGEPIKK